MPRIVVPFRGSGAKQRLAVGGEVRAALAFAMFEDVLATCVAVGDVVVVTDDARARQAAEEAGAEVVDDPGLGQGAAVAAALQAGAPALVVNADLPCADADDVRALLAATPAGGLALVAAADGTTNALSLADARLFPSVYGPGSAARFCEHAAALGAVAVRVSIPNLAADVDTLDDLRDLELRAGPHTRTALAPLGASA